MTLLVSQWRNRADRRLDRRKLHSLALFALVSAATTGSLVRASAPGAQTAEPIAPLHSYIAADDYPDDAITKGEQGTVEFLLTVGLDGQPTDCVVTSSSGSSSLDSASCLIMMERARFRPAKNAAGKPVTGDYQSRIAWRLEGPEPSQGLSAPSAVNTATNLWFACSWGEAAKLVTSEFSAADISTRAFIACAPLEERIAVEMQKAGIKGLVPAKMIPELKNGFKAKLLEMLDSSRAALKGSARN